MMHLCKTLRISLDDLLAVTRKFFCENASHLGVDRCLCRHGVGNLHAIKPKAPVVPHKAFNDYELWYVHVIIKFLPQMSDEKSQTCLFVANDLFTRCWFTAIEEDKTAHGAKAFLTAVYKTCQIKINKIFTDSGNGKEFIVRSFASRERLPSGNLEFDQLCLEPCIEYRLTLPRTPKTNVMAERFNCQISEVLNSHRTNGFEDVRQTLSRCMDLYNHHFPKSAIKCKTPIQTMRDWYGPHPHFFSSFQMIVRDATASKQRQRILLKWLQNCNFVSLQPWNCPSPNRLSLT